MPQSTPRRLYPRQLRRLAVRFWREGEDRARQGFTKNLSLTGAFVSTPDPAGRGERLRLELSDAGRRALVDAVVVHSHRVPPELRRFAESAMGLRFLGLDETVGPFLGKEALQPESGAAAGGVVGGGTGGFPTAAAGGGGAGGVPSGAVAGGGGRSGAGPAAGTPGGAGSSGARAGDGGESRGGDDRGAPARASGGGAAAGGEGVGGSRYGGAGGGAGISAAGGEEPVGSHFAEPPGGGGADTFAAGSPAAPSASGGPPLAAGSGPAGGGLATYSLRFATGNDFLATYRRDLLNGGLFVTTDRPARLNDRVAVDLRLPGASALTIRVEGRVVQVVEPRPLASGRTAGGMGLELIDPDAAIGRLAPHVAAYER